MFSYIRNEKKKLKGSKELSDYILICKGYWPPSRAEVKNDGAILSLP
jgi:hypothetical protein